MFGILNSKPGYTSAFFLALKEPVRIGNTSIGVGQIEDILRLANIKDPAVIAAAERFKGLSKQIEAIETRILLGGEGQITEGERRIVTAIVPTLSDPKEVVKAKAELTIARAQFDQKALKLLMLTHAKIKMQPTLILSLILIAHIKNYGAITENIPQILQTHIVRVEQKQKEIQAQQVQNQLPL
jgi:hypothetical protein